MNAEERVGLLADEDGEKASGGVGATTGEVFSWQGANKSEASLENVTIDALFLNFEYVHKEASRAPQSAVEMLMNLDRAFQLTEYDRRARQSHFVALLCMVIMVGVVVKTILEATVVKTDKGIYHLWYVALEIIVIAVVTIVPFGTWAIFTAPCACSRRQYRFLGSELVAGRVIPAALFGVILALELLYALVGATGYGATMMLIAAMYTFFPIKIVDAHCLALSAVSLFCLITYVANIEDLEMPPALGGRTVDPSEPLATLMPWPKRFARSFALAIMTMAIAVDTHRRTLSAMKNFLVELVAVSAAHKLQDLKQQSDALLASMLPPNILQRMQRGRPMNAEYYPSATVIFCEICNFDKICSELEPNDVVRVLNIAYSKFDELLEDYGRCVLIYRYILNEFC